MKTYLNWVKNTEHEADTLSQLAKMDPAQARIKHDLWNAGLTPEPLEYTRLETEIEAAGRDPARKEFDELRWKSHHAVSIFLREVRLYLDGKRSTDYARIAVEQAVAAKIGSTAPTGMVRTRHLPIHMGCPEYVPHLIAKGGETATATALRELLSVDVAPLSSRTESNRGVSAPPVATGRLALTFQHRTSDLGHSGRVVAKAKRMD